MAIVNGTAFAWQGSLKPARLAEDAAFVAAAADVLVREGKLKPGQLSPENIATNKYNDYAHLAQHG